MMNQCWVQPEDLHLFLCMRAWLGSGDFDSFAGGSDGWGRAWEPATPLVPCISNIPEF